MKRILTSAIASILLVSAIITTPVAKADPAIYWADKALERAYSSAATVAERRPTGRGCETIPFSDLQRECSQQAVIRARWCSRPNSPRGCAEFRNPLAQADRARDLPRIRQILRDCTERQNHADTCLRARQATQLAFKQAEGRVRADQRKFSDEARRAKNAEMREFYEQMGAYATTILAYFNDERDGHNTQITQVQRVLTECDQLVDAANRANR